MNRKILTLVAAGLLAIGSAAASTSAADTITSQAQASHVIQLASADEDQTYGPFSSEAMADMFKKNWGRWYKTYKFWIPGRGYYVKVYFSQGRMPG